MICTRCKQRPAMGGDASLPMFTRMHCRECADEHKLPMITSALPVLPKVATDSTSIRKMSAEGKSPPPAKIELRSLDEAHAVFTRWLGDEYDLDALDVVLCAAAAERLTGDPLWLLVVSGSGAAKTETVQALTGAGALLTSTISSEGALLSATPKREKAKDATGGLLRRIGEHGVLVVKDVSSILSMNRDTRASVLAALREVYDGNWSRNVGTDGGRTLSWKGRIAVIGAVTTAWDSAHAVISSMGDRFVLIRLDSSTGRVGAGRHTLGNTGSEIEMRADLAGVAGGVIAGIDLHADLRLTEEEAERLLAAADVVTLARTGVEFDYRGDVIDAHAPEMPTRFTRQLQQVFRGGLALGMDRRRALRLAIRCARDSMPPLRLAILEDVAKNPQSATPEVRRRIDKPRNTVDRQLQALHMLGVLTCTESEYVKGAATGKVWRYSVRNEIDPNVLVVPDLLVDTSKGEKRESEQTSSTLRASTDKSGTTGALTWQEPPQPPFGPSRQHQRREDRDDA